MDTKHLTILFTDMKGFTSKTSVQTRDELESLIELQDQLIRPIFAKFKGRVVKTIGDAFMVVFESPTNAVLCGIKVQETVLAHNEKAGKGERMEIRVGINSGEVNIRGDDFFGEAVNIASRIEGIAEANEVYFSDSVYLSMNKNEVPSAEVGVRHLKGIPDHIKVYRVLRDRSEIERSKNERHKLATSSNAFSKSGGASALKESTSVVALAGRGWKIAVGIIVTLFLVVVVMWIFKICPPQGPWMSPPWCSATKRLPTGQQKDAIKGIIQDRVQDKIQNAPLQQNQPPIQQKPPLQNGVRR